MPPNQQLCTFTLEGQLFGLEVTRVQEVLREQEMTRVPHAHHLIRGLINLRGEIVMAIDLRLCLGLDPSLRNNSVMNLVVRSAEGPVSFLVDVIHDVIEVAETSFEPPPATLRGPARQLIRGSYFRNQELLLALDADAVLALIEAPRE